MKFTIRAMKTYPAEPTLGLFDVKLLLQWLGAKGIPLSGLDAVNDRESYRNFVGRMEDPQSKLGEHRGSAAVGRMI